MELLEKAADLVAASGGDPLVRHLLPHVAAGTPMFASDGAVGLVYNYWDGPGAQFVGPPRAAAALLREVADALPTTYVSIPEDADALLPRDLLTPSNPWCFRWTDMRPTAPPASAGWLAVDELGEVEALLETSFPTASARPGNRHVVRWAGTRDAGGALIATAADCTESDVGFMASVTTDVGLRRSGLGLAMTAWMTHALLDDHGIAALWQYSDNRPATALYDRLGFRDEHRYVAGELKA